ncbi:MAG: hypothetical protein HW412_1084 [Bacteroidetes bacterium]|nr:hypothetical protein [Bacteroidota bacterium]
MVKRYCSRALPFFVALALVGSESVRLDAQTQITIGASKDNTLYEDVNGALSNGAGQHFFAGRNGQLPGTSIRRGLIAFDVAGNIPQSATILSVMLTLSMSQTTSLAQQIGLYRASADWGEGTSIAGGNEGGGAPATIGDATWIHKFFNTSLWSTAGGEFVGTPSATQSVAGLGPYTWGSTAEMISDVQQWLNAPSSNFGWVLVGDETVTRTAKRFDSKEDTIPSVRPQLSITYQPPVSVNEQTEIPHTFALHQNYPNPFNPTTTMTYALPKKEHVTLRVFNLLGQEVATLVDEVQEAGTRSVKFSSRGLATGLYFYRFSSESFSQTRKLVVLK